MRSGLKKVWLKKVCLAASFAGILAASIPTAAFGATKAISSVVIRVGLNVEAGDYLPDNPSTIDDSTEAQKDEDAYAGTNNTKYYVRDAEWVTTTHRALAVGDRPRMRVYIEANSGVGDSDYVFRGTYGSGNITVKGGTFVSARRHSTSELEVVIALNGVKGEYSAPAEASWRNSGYGKAVWSEDEYTRKMSSGYYDVYLYRGNTVVKKLEEFQGTSYDFYPYMTQAGTYYYKVRTVPHTADQKTYGKKSGWEESDEFYIDKDHVSDGTGQVDGNGVSAGSTGQVGWILSDGIWYYRYPDGTYQSNSWLQLNGIWYLFDGNGRMLTGWQVRNGLTYFLQDSGAMYTGWIKAGDMWYYMNRLEDGGVEGAMRTGWLVRDGKTYYLRSDGSMAEGWTQIDGNYYYFYPGSGYKAVNTYIDTFWVNADGIWRR